MGCGERERVDAFVVEQGARYGPETRGLLSALVQGFQLLASLIQRHIDLSANLAILQSPETFAFTKTPNSTDITPGTAREVAANKSNELVAVYVRAETYSPGIASHLILDIDQTRTTLAKAKMVKYAVAPEATLLLEPNQRLYADVTDSSGGLQATFVVTATVISLPGARLF